MYRKYPIARVLLVLGAMGALLPAGLRAANSNPTVTFQSSATNATNAVGKNFYLRLYSLSGFTNQANRLINITNFSTNGTNVSQQTFSNDLVSFQANFNNPAAITNLGNTNGTNGLRFDPTNGVLYGIPTNNFILSISNGGIQVISTNLTWTVTNTYSNNILRLSATSTVVTNVFTNNATTNPAYRFVFQATPVITFTNTNMAANTTNALPSTNTNGLPYTYTNLSGPGYVTNSTNLVATNAGSISLQVAITPGTDGANATWKPVTNTYVVLATNPLATNFGFVTNGSSNPTTATSLVYKGSTPLVLSNAGSARVTFALNRPAAGRFFVSNGVTNLQALSGVSILVITANRAATATSAPTTALLTSTLSRASNPITMAGFFSNYPSTNTVTNPNTTSLALLATASNGTVVFTTTDTNLVRITNGTTLLLLANGTSRVVASVINVNTNNYSNAVPVTNTVIVNWSSPAAPVFTSTNQQNGTVGVSFLYTLTATASNTNAFPVIYTATNLPAGLSFNNPNLILGTPTQPGLYRIQLTASNAGGITTNILTSAIAPATAFTVTNQWTNYVALGTGTNTNGTYTFASNLPTGIGSVTNSNGSTPPVLVLSNANTNTNTSNWFAGLTNLNVVFSNSQTNFTSPVTLNVLPGTPALTMTSRVTGTPGLLLSLTGTVTPAALTNIPGYPLSFRSSNLPSGLILNLTSGVISGKPVYAGVTTSSVWVTNVAGTSSTSPVTFNVQAMAGAPVQLSVAFTNQAGTYSVPNLPPGLTLAPASGLVTGSPQAVGTFDLTVNFVQTGTATTNSNTTPLVILPPAPIPVVPVSIATVKAGQPLTLQPYVTGPGWGWAGADPLTNSTINSSLWTNQLEVGTNTVVLSSNSGGRILATGRGLTFVNLTNENSLNLLWKSNLPSSYPWQALLRIQVPATTLTNGMVSPLLELFPSQTSYGTNYNSNDGQVFADATSDGVNPGAAFFAGEEGVETNLSSLVGTNEIFVRMRYEADQKKLIFAVNTNLSSNTYIGVLTNTDVPKKWFLDNSASLPAFRLQVGSYFSEQIVAPNEIFIRSFSVIPLGVRFYASTDAGATNNNLPGWLSCDPETGLLYGTAPTNASSQMIYLYATNSQGTNFTGFRLRVVAP